MFSNRLPCECSLGLFVCLVYGNFPKPRPFDGGLFRVSNQSTPSHPASCHHQGNGWKTQFDTGDPAKRQNKQWPQQLWPFLPTGPQACRDVPRPIDIIEDTEGPGICWPVYPPKGFFRAWWILKNCPQRMEILQIRTNLLSVLGFSRPVMGMCFYLNLHFDPRGGGLRPEFSHVQL